MTKTKSKHNGKTKKKTRSKIPKNSKSTKLIYERTRSRKISNSNNRSPKSALRKSVPKRTPLPRSSKNSPTPLRPNNPKPRNPNPVPNSRTKKNVSTKNNRSIKKSVDARSSKPARVTSRRSNKPKIITHKPRKVTLNSKRTSRTRYRVKAYFRKNRTEYYQANKKYLPFDKKILVEKTPDIDLVMNKIESLKPDIKNFYELNRKKDEEQFYSMGYDIKLYYRGPTKSKFKKIVDQVSYMPATLKLTGIETDAQIAIMKREMFRRYENYLLRSSGDYKVSTSGIDLEVQTSELRDDEDVFINELDAMLEKQLKKKKKK